MSNYYFSPSTLSFYPFEIFDSYKASNSLPDDIVEVTDDTFQAYSVAPPVGKTRGVDTSGQPVWVDLPPLTQAELVAQADAVKQVLISSAKDTISIWQSDLLLGGISDDDKASLIAWIAYIKEVNAVDTSKAPDITWPAKPAS